MMMNMMMNIMMNMMIITIISMIISTIIRMIQIVISIIIRPRVIPYFRWTILASIDKDMDACNKYCAVLLRTSPTFYRTIILQGESHAHVVLKCPKLVSHSVQAEWWPNWKIQNEHSHFPSPSLGVSWKSKSLVHFCIETDGDLGCPHFRKPPLFGASILELSVSVFGCQHPCE